MRQRASFHTLLFQFSFISLLFLHRLPSEAATTTPTTTTQPDPLESLRPSHPRLLVLDDQITKIKLLTASDPTAAQALKDNLATATKMLDEPSVQHLVVGPRMLTQSRRALQIIATCAGIYRLTGDERFADRARKEMLTVAAFADWNPSHFLDAAEMTNACGIGYDWLYDRPSPEDRKTIRNAIIQFGLKPAFDKYEKTEFWTNANHNWAQVCPGGLLVGALAIADEEPEIARKIIALTYTTITKPMAEFAPDGGWGEGPGYWGYGTKYNVFYLSALQTALGTDMGLTHEPGFSETGLFHIYCVGPIGKSFNFADAGEKFDPAPQMFWLATQFNKPVYAAWERTMWADRFDIFHLLWFNPQGSWPGDNPLPLNALFHHINVGFFRGSWTDANSWYVGFKGGDNKTNHSHLDLGSFVLDAMGHRWAVELGPDNYNLPAYFLDKRWTYYRLRTEGQNAITINGANQDPKAAAPITSFISNPENASAIIDLTAAYPQAATSAKRGIAFLDRRRVLVQDELTIPNPAQIVWNFHTRATATVGPDGSSAILTEGDAKLRARILSPTGAKFTVISAEQLPPQATNEGVSNLTISLPDTTGNLRIAVLFSATDDPAIPDVAPLSTWRDK